MCMEPAGLGYSYSCGVLRDCGTYVTYDEGSITESNCNGDTDSGAGSSGDESSGDESSGDGSSGDGSSSGGTSDGTAGMGSNFDGCEPDNEVLACILDAVANQEAFTFRHHHNPGDIFGYDRAYWLPGEGLMFDSRTNYEDLAYTRTATTREEPDLAACADWGCIQQQVEGVALQQTCLTQTISEGV